MNALAIHNLTKTYRNGVIALQGIDLCVKEGDFFALLGPNGAGKSTAIGIICSLINKSGGTVEVFGKNLDLDPNGVKSCIGLVPQEFNFNQFEPIIEILVNQAGYYGIPRPRAFIEAEQQLKRIDLWEKRNVMARELSGGMKRRLMIARALIHQPRLLILDEPTAGVDVEIRRSMWEFLSSINREGTTIILTTHYLEEAENLCRNIAIINNGKIAENQSMRELLGRAQQQQILLSLAKPLSSAPNLEHFDITLKEDSSLEVIFDQEHDLTYLFEQLSQQGIRVTGMRNKQNRLERIMLDMADQRSTQNKATP